MTFGGPRNHAMARWSTWDEAVEGHMREVQLTIKAIRDVNAIALETGAKVR
jgi:hypothetical protein